MKLKYLFVHLVEAFALMAVAAILILENLK